MHVFKKKTKKFEIFHVASNKHLTVRKFAENYWKNLKLRKLIFKNEKKTYSRHLSDISSIWKIKNEQSNSNNSLWRKGNTVSSLEKNYQKL